MFRKNASEQWNVGEQERDCFVCNRANLVYVLYNRSTVQTDFEVIRNKKIRDTLFEYYNLSHYTQDLPVVLGSSTSWNPVKMMPQMFCALLRLCKTIQKNAGEVVLENMNKKLLIKDLMT